MKRIVIVCLLGMGLLLPSTTITAKNFIAKRVVDVYLENGSLLATSDANTGTLVQIDIFDNHDQKVRGQACSGYSCSISLSGLGHGTYSAHVTTTLTTYYENFTII